ncbi:alpha/beta hydrolase [Candidatus Poriferisodalis sp.]|uniref:alpha/beta hydrolase n=1 Tax=Candidatus Poriferisodalis sp. TaxID=3101277 RepID=UPI003B0218AC
MKGLDWRYRVLAGIPFFNPGISSMSDIAHLRARHDRAPRWATGRPASGVVNRHLRLPPPHTSLRVRVDEPTERCDGPLPLIVYVHGGAWMFSDMDTPEWLTTRVARQTPSIVASVEYRLAPEHPFPAAVEDCCHAFSWLAEHAEQLGADSRRIAVMGDSAGGNLAAVLCLMARAREWPPIRHQTLIYPALDLTLSSASIDSEADHGFATRAQLETVRRLYLGEADATDWRASPLHADLLKGLPAAHIIVAGHDPLRDDGIRYAKRLRDNNVRATLSTYATMTHGFLALRFAPTMRRRAVTAIVNEVAAAFS